MADVDRRHTEDWRALPWKRFQRDVFRLQKRIYQASSRDDYKQVHNLQRLLLRSWSARCLAVRKVTQDNRGKRTPGVDGVASLTPKQRLALARDLQDLTRKPDPIRRTYIPKSSGGQRPLGIPTMSDRARQALVKLALEPEWEARFEPNSYGFRPGRSTHDAIEAIFLATRLKPKYVLDTDIEKCFEKINHEDLLAKLSTIEPITRLVRGWLKAGIVDDGETLYPEAGVPQGGPLSPLLANVALHGLEQELTNVPRRKRPKVIRYADDLVVLHHDLAGIQIAQEKAEKWLNPRGLRLKPSKTRITHTLYEHEGQGGFDFLGFTVRQFPVGKYRTSTYRGQPGYKTLIRPSEEAQKRHLRKTGEVIRKHRGNSQAALIAELAPIVQGWSNYYRACAAKKTLARVDHDLFHQLYKWAVWRHPKKSWTYRYTRYWSRWNGRIEFTDGRSVLLRHQFTKIQYHTKVRGNKSPFDGDWPYWIARLGHDPTKPRRVVNLLKRQKGCCSYCGLSFMADDILEVHHVDGNRWDRRYINLLLLHGHCHDQLHGK
jgi:RNA-directed DNA polymerase